MRLKKDLNISQAMDLIFCLLAAVLILISVCSPAAAANSFLPVMASDTLDYYAGYGEPDLAASLRGNQEFGKGESAAIQITIANKGMIERLSYREYVISERINMTSGYVDNPDFNPTYDPVNNPVGSPDPYIPKTMITPENLTAYMIKRADTDAQVTLATTEMKLEANRINAESLNIKFDCDSPHIEVETGGDYVYLAALVGGGYNVVSVPIQISPNAPAGEYLINMTVDYQYQSNVKMIKAGNGTDGFTTFLYSDSYVAEYTPKQVVLQIPVYVKNGAVFEVSKSVGMLDSGRTRDVSVTYKNIGDRTAYDAESKIDLMYPLSSSRNKGFLGDVAPGESVTIVYPISTHSSALPKVYGMNTDVRFYDDNKDLQITPGIKLNLELVEQFRIFTLKNAMIGVFVFIILSLVLDVYKGQMKKKDADYSFKRVLQSKSKRK
jgi:S-layer domain